MPPKVKVLISPRVWVKRLALALMTSALDARERQFVNHINPTLVEALFKACQDNAVNFSAAQPVQPCKPTLVDMFGPGLNGLTKAELVYIKKSALSKAGIKRICPLPPDERQIVLRLLVGTVRSNKRTSKRNDGVFHMPR